MADRGLGHLLKISIIKTSVRFTRSPQTRHPETRNLHNERQTRSSGKKTVQRKYVMMRKWPAQVTNKQCNLLLGKKNDEYGSLVHFFFVTLLRKHLAETVSK